MKNLIILLFTILGLSSLAQQTDYNLKKGFAAEGYDVTEYFNNNAQEGSLKYTTTYDGVKFKFVSQANLDKFMASPASFIPQYGGYCAYAIANKGKKIGVDPETFEIIDGKLYLFYNSWGTNTLDKWNEEGAAVLRKKADIEWQGVSTKN